MWPKLDRLRRMDARELAWRGRALTYSLVDRFVCAIREPRWHRRDLRGALAADSDLAAVRRALRERRWADAHCELVEHYARRGSRFVIRSVDRQTIAAGINRAFPGAAVNAAARADRLIAGRYDLLGYSALDFTPPARPAPPAHSALPDWHYDPVNHRRAPRRFWTAVPYLDPRCGDHKIIWELNRHQHWIALGRAYWLTGDIRYRDRCIAELNSWLAANPPLIGINWASMLELGLRCISWIWALHFFADTNDRDSSESPWTVDLLLALDRQLTQVERNLSYYFSPNTHLIGEALALYVAGQSLPELAASKRRATVGRRILVSEIARQIEPDGGHCERSTHYHRYTLDFYTLALVVARITEDPIAAVFERAVARLGAAARVLADDFGRAPHFGDDDGGALFAIAGRAADDWRDSMATAACVTRCPDLKPHAAPIPEETLWMLAHPVAAASRDDRSHAAARSLHGLSASAALPGTGYFVSRSDSGEHVVIDGGPHGYLNGGHAHADALSLTASVRGLPFLIDPGTACYTIDQRLRDRFRSTALHNTVVVDGRSQSIPNGPFHWTHTADAVSHRWRSSERFDYFDGSHMGYAPAIHRRRVLMLHGGVIVVADHVGFPVDGRAREAAVHWHVGPGWIADAHDRRVDLASRHDRVALLASQGRIDLFTADDESGLGWCSPVYGRLERCTTVRIGHSGAAPFWLVSVFDLNPADPVRRLDSLPVWAEAGATAHATAIRIERRGSTDYVLFAEPARADVRSTWRVAELETDARMLFARQAPAGQLTELALVDGSFVRGGGHRAVGVALGHVAPALHIDETSIRNYTPCAASPGS